MKLVFDKNDVCVGVAKRHQHFAVDDACPSCGAAPGRACKGPNGTLMPLLAVHKARTEHALGGR